MTKIRKSALSVVIARLAQEHPDEYRAANDADCNNPLNWDQHDVLDLAERYYPADRAEAVRLDGEYAAAEDTGTVTQYEQEHRQ